MFTPHDFIHRLQKLTLRTKEIVTCESIAEGFHLNGNKS